MFTYQPDRPLPRPPLHGGISAGSSWGVNASGSNGGGRRVGASYKTGGHTLAHTEMDRFQDEPVAVEPAVGIEPADGKHENVTYSNINIDL